MLRCEAMNSLAAVITVFFSCVTKLLTVYMSSHDYTGSKMFACF